MMNLFTRSLNFCDRIAIILSEMAMAVMAVSVIAGILWRYFLNQPLSWTEELSRFLLIFVTFIGACPMIMRGGFGQVESIIQKLKPKPRYIWDLMIALFSILFTGIATGLGSYLVFISPATKNQITPALHIPMQFIYAFMPFGFALMFLRETERFLRKFVLQSQGGHQ